MVHVLKQMFPLKMREINDYVLQGKRNGHSGNPGLWTQVLDSGLWMLDSGRWTLDAGLWTLDSELWAEDSGRWTLDAGLWTLHLRS